jgi:hypothetical protein
MAMLWQIRYTTIGAARKAPLNIQKAIGCASSPDTRFMPKIPTPRVPDDSATCACVRDESQKRE